MQNLLGYNHKPITFSYRHSDYFSFSNFNNGTAAYYKQLEMWANAQRDGRPAEYRWRPLFNAAKFG